MKNLGVKQLNNIAALMLGTTLAFAPTVVFAESPAENPELGGTPYFENVNKAEEALPDLIEEEVEVETPGWALEGHKGNGDHNKTFKVDVVVGDIVRCDSSCEIADVLKDNGKVESYAAEAEYSYSATVTHDMDNNKNKGPKTTTVAEGEGSIELYLGNIAGEGGGKPPKAPKK